MGTIRRRPDMTHEEVIEGSRDIFERLDKVTQRLEQAVDRFASEIADPSDHPDYHDSSGSNGGN